MYYNRLCLTRVTINSLATDKHTCVWPSDPRSNWNLEVLVFEEEGIPKYSAKNPRSKDETQLNPYITPGPGLEPEPHWQEALATAPSLLLSKKKSYFELAGTEKINKGNLIMKQLWSDSDPCHSSKIFIRKQDRNRLLNWAKMARY